MSSDSPIFQSAGLYEAEPSDNDEDLALTTFHKSLLEYLMEDRAEEDKWEQWQ